MGLSCPLQPRSRGAFLAATALRQVDPYMALRRVEAIIGLYAIADVFRGSAIIYIHNNSHLQKTSGAFGTEINGPPHGS